MKNIVDRMNRDFKDILFDFDSPPGPAREEMAKLEAALAAERCLAGERVLPTSLKPCFVPRSRITYVEKVVESLMDALEKMVRLYFENPDYRDLFELDAVEEDLVQIPSGLPGRHIVFARADSFLTDEMLMFLEFNCDSPGGAYYTDVQTGLLAETAPMVQLQQRYDLGHEPLVPRVMDVLLTKYEEWGGARTRPTIAVVGDGNVTNVNEFVLFGEYFERQGFSGFFAEPWDLAYDGNVLSHQGRPINIIYRRGVIDDLSKNPERTRAMTDAIRDGNVCLINPLTAKLGDNKNLLSLLTDERLAAVLDETQRTFVERHIPWTRVLREGQTTHMGLTVDLLEYVSGNRERFVVKPNAAYGGKGVVIGREATTAEWHEALESRVRQKMVVQEYVPVPREEYPVFAPELHFVEKKVNHNFFVFDGQYVGGFARISDSSIINVSAGGGLVPFLVVEDE